MNATEFKQVLVDLGKRDITDAQVQEMLKQVDRNNDNVIQWTEFLEVINHHILSNSIDVQNFEELKQRLVLTSFNNKSRVMNIIS